MLLFDRYRETSDYQYFTKKDPRPVRGSPGDRLLIVFVNY